MKTTLALALLLSVALSLAAEESPAPPEKPIKKEIPPNVVAAAKTFFDALDERPQRLALKSPERATPNERAAMEWLLQSVINRGRSVQNPAAGFTLRRGKPDEEHVKSSLKYAAGNRVKLDPTKTYIHIKYEGMACPETHGIIDPTTPALILYWTDAGG